jgi:hypothetical protein
LQNGSFVGSVPAKFIAATMTGRGVRRTWLARSGGETCRRGGLHSAVRRDWLFRRVGCQCFRRVFLLRRGTTSELRCRRSFRLRRGIWPPAFVW